MICMREYCAEMLQAEAFLPPKENKRLLDGWHDYLNSAHGAFGRNIPGNPVQQIKDFRLLARAWRLVRHKDLNEEEASETITKWKELAAQMENARPCTPEELVELALLRVLADKMYYLASDDAVKGAHHR